MKIQKFTCKKYARITCSRSYKWLWLSIGINDDTDIVTAYANLMFNDIKSDLIHATTETDRELVLKIYKPPKSGKDVVVSVVFGKYQLIQVCQPQKKIIWVIQSSDITQIQQALNYIRPSNPDNIFGISYTIDQILKN
jgi:hypothetical protein